MRLRLQRRVVLQHCVQDFLADKVPVKSMLEHVKVGLQLVEPLPETVEEECHVILQGIVYFQVGYKLLISSLTLERILKVEHAVQLEEKPQSFVITQVVIV